MSTPSLASAISLVIALVATAKLIHACGKDRPTPTCGSMMGVVHPSTDDTTAYLAQFDQATQTRDLIVQSCVAENWSQDAIDCIARSSGLVSTVLTSCESEIGTAKLQALETKLRDQRIQRTP
jgi:hypothetical protein